MQVRTCVFDSKAIKFVECLYRNNWIYCKIYLPISNPNNIK